MFIQVGYGNYVLNNKVVAIVGADTAPVKRVIKEAKNRGRCVDTTNGRRTRAAIITDSDHVILSAIYPETIVKRIDSKEVEEM